MGPEPGLATSRETILEGGEAQGTVSPVVVGFAALKVPESVPQAPAMP